MPDNLPDLIGPHLLPVDAWGNFRSGARRAAVVALLYRKQGDWHLPLVLRRSDLPHHPGQVGLPGGSLDPGEEAWTAAARELGEELGVSPAGAHPLGAGRSIYAAVSNFSVVPFVAWFEEEDPTFTADPGELVGVLEVPLARLLEEDAWQWSELPYPGRYFAWEGVEVWGFTERMLADLLPRFRAAIASA